jgi:phosphinothricin acetyltransferase
MKECRRLVRSDVPAVTRLFNEGIDGGDLTADVAHRTDAQIAAWLLGPAPQFESYVVDAGDGAIAWASLTRHHEREAYSPTAELTVYVGRTARRRGLGSALGEHVALRARSLSLHSLVMLLRADRPHAVRVAEKLGFRAVGTLRQVLVVGDDWLDVTLFQRRLAPVPA